MTLPLAYLPPSVGSFAVSYTHLTLVLELFPAGGEQITFGRVLFMLFHQAEIEAYNGGEEHHIQG